MAKLPEPLETRLLGPAAAPGRVCGAPHCGAPLKPAVDGVAHCTVCTAWECDRCRVTLPQGAAHADCRGGVLDPEEDMDDAEAEGAWQAGVPDIQNAPGAGAGAGGGPGPRRPVATRMCPTCGAGPFVKNKHCSQVSCPSCKAPFLFRNQQADPGMVHNPDGAVVEAAVEAAAADMRPSLRFLSGPDYDEDWVEDSLKAVAAGVANLPEDSVAHQVIDMVFEALGDIMRLQGTVPLQRTFLGMLKASVVRGVGPCCVNEAGEADCDVPTHPRPVDSDALGATLSWRITAFLRWLEPLASFQQSMLGFLNNEGDRLLPRSAAPDAVFPEGAAVTVAARALHCACCLMWDVEGLCEKFGNEDGVRAIRDLLIPMPKEVSALSEAHLANFRALLVGVIDANVVILKMEMEKGAKDAAASAAGPFLGPAGDGGGSSSM
jgi:hypothetical protein